MPVTIGARSRPAGRLRAAAPVIIAFVFALACASDTQPEVDVGALAAQHGLERGDLSLFLTGYEEGFDAGTARSAGMRAGVGAGGGSGVEGRGWQLGFQDAMNGRPRQDAEELARRLGSEP